MDIIWKDIKGYEGLYEVSNTGYIKSLQFKKPFIKKFNKNHQGYLSVSLYKDNENKLVKVHRVVAEAFISNPENKPQVNHKDGNKANNCVENLEWVTASENIKHSYANGLQSVDLRKVKVSKYTLEGTFVKTYDSIAEASADTGVSMGNITTCCQGKLRYTRDCTWRYGSDRKDIEPVKLKTISVRQYDLDGNFIKEYKSAYDAGKSLNLDRSSITKCCKGKVNKVGEYIFKYSR